MIQNALTLCLTLGALVACTGVSPYHAVDYPSQPVAAGLTVEPTYWLVPDWAQYVVNDGATIYGASGDNCSATGQTRAAQCLHSGELRKLVLPAVSSCAGLVVGDALGAVGWTCVAGGGRVTLYSTGLKPLKGLRDLIDGAGPAWRPNAVVVTGAVNLSTAPAVWWSNPVAVLPSNAGPTDVPVSLSAAGTVYVATTSAFTRGYQIKANQISIVTLGASELSYVGTPVDNCSDADGAYATLDAATVICAGANAFAWIEADVSTGGAALDQTMLFYGTHFVRLHRVTAHGRDVVFSALHGPRVDDLRVNFGGLRFYDGGGGVLTRLQMPAGVLVLGNVTRTTVTDVLVGGRYQGLYLTGSSNNALTRFTIMGLETNGVEFSVNPSSDNILSFFTIVNAGTFGIADYASANGLFHNFAIVNSGTHGVNATRTASYSHFVTLNNRYNGIYNNSANNKFSGVFMTGGNGGSNCLLPGTAPGLDGSCTGTDLSAGLLTTRLGRSAATAFTGRLYVTDPANSSNVAGAAGYPAAGWSFDYINFTTLSSGVPDLFTLWGADGGVFPAVNQQGSWEHIGGSGRIWDVSLASTDAVLRNTTGDGLTPNAALVDGAPCPAWTSTTLTNIGGTLTYLANAYEITGDGLGNDNGLCESNEACVAAPNFGAYQGDGDWRACAFVDGAVTGVKMSFFSINGR